MAAPAAAAPLNEVRQKIVDAAIQAAKDSAGNSYTVNGRTVEGFDCSGFVTYVYKKVFPNYLHLNTNEIAASALFQKTLVPQPGDLIFFPKGINPYDKKTYPNHVAVVIDNQTWMSSQTSTGVAPVKMINPWWAARVKYFLRYQALP